MIISFLNKIIRYWETLRHLKFIQIRYQLFYLFRRKLGWKARLKYPKKNISTQKLKLQNSVPSYKTYLHENHFSFLNIDYHFNENIDWNFAEYGKLWTYNLNYFEYLLQPDFDKEIGIKLIHDFIKNEVILKDGLEPFPISLRSIFWIKFLVKNEVQDTKIDTFLYAQLKLLTQQLEFHLMGNHLLENGFALLFGAYYFNEKAFFDLAKNILLEQLEEQILEDGAHFELSPMYHQLMLFRALDSVNLLKNNAAIFDDDLLPFLKEKATEMMGWLKAMQFENGTLPNFNDSSVGIAPSSQDLLNYGQELGLVFKKNQLKSSGYRKITTKTYETIVDIGDIGPDYIPGHAHSDMMNFVLHHRGQPILVDTGISTYEKNAKRHSERSTAAHNTVKVREEEQSDIWGGFRVGYRAKITHLEEKEKFIKATYNGHSHFKISHSRTYEFEEKNIQITDELKDGQWGRAYFHFHPTITITADKGSVFGNFGQLVFNNFTRISLEKYEYARGFNLTEPATVVIVYFDKRMHTRIHLI